MARRVKQADGSYCYTENCRIHDRSGDSTGVQAIINDAKITRLNSFVSTASVTFKDQFNLREEEAASIGSRAIEGAMNSENGVTPYTLSEAIKDAARAEGMDPTGLDTLPAAYIIHSEMITTALIKPGDEVILNATGERGVIAEGNSAFGGAVRFNPESIRSRNSFAWFQPSDVTKVVADEKSLAREQIVAAGRDHLIPVKLIKQLLDEETSKTTRNAQGVKEMGRQAKAARANLLAFGDKIEEQFPREHFSKNNALAFLVRAYDRPIAREMPEAELKATKSALRNIITYLDPTGDYR